ncbi:AraC family transcriptional regulator [Desulfovibrio sp. JC010]|uniref:AraC family transcriptional regulator n=1 Tax=Desulfovibrio sp. JC010 TaxID=2593641 RepID=UPI0013D658F4|nr:AraC family transcriptional regulator [Desulfovibrio sp. JC010]NDV27551.1 AraC family transcriptional regulator [Desulfovibrio sp. JC010]
MMQELITTLEKLTPAEGYGSTHLPEVAVFRAQKNVPTMPIIYEQTICIAVQGRKITRTADRVLEYNPEHFVVVPTIMPFECETIYTEEEPFLGLAVDIDFSVVQEIMDMLGDKFSEASMSMEPSPGMYLEKFDSKMQESCLRLLRSLENESDAMVLGRQMIREIYYRTLMSENGHILASAAGGESAYAKIAKAIRTIHDNYAESLDVAQLAKTASMSPRSFQRHFKAATDCTPIQYLKRIRLDRARHLLVRKGLQANVTSHMVGYESTSQFSREFKGYFGYPPRDAHKAVIPGLVR